MLGLPQAQVQILDQQVEQIAETKPEAPLEEVVQQPAPSLTKVNSAATEWKKPSF